MKKVIAGIALAAGLLAGATALAPAASATVGDAPSVMDGERFGKPGYEDHWMRCSGKPDGSLCYSLDSGRTQHLNLM